MHQIRLLILENDEVGTVWALRLASSKFVAKTLRQVISHSYRVRREFAQKTMQRAN